MIRGDYFFAKHVSDHGSSALHEFVAGKLVDSETIQQDKEINYTAVVVATNIVFKKLASTVPSIFTGVGYTSIGSHTSTLPGKLLRMKYGISLL